MCIFLSESRNPTRAGLDGSVLYVPPWDMTTRDKMTNSWYPTLKKGQESEERTQKCATDLAVCWGQHTEVNKRRSQQQGGKSVDDFSVLTLLNPSTESLTCSLHTTSATLSKYCTECYRAQLLQTSVISKSLVPKGSKTTRYSSTSPEQTAGSWWIKKYSGGSRRKHFGDTFTLEAFGWCWFFKDGASECCSRAFLEGKRAADGHDRAAGFIFIITLSLRSYLTFMGLNYKIVLITSNIYWLFSVNISGSSFFFRIRIRSGWWDVVFCYITKLLEELLYWPDDGARFHEFRIFKV